MQPVTGLKKAFLAVAASAGLGGCAVLPDRPYNHTPLPRVTPPTVVYVDRGNNGYLPPVTVAPVYTPPYTTYGPYRDVYRPSPFRNSWNIWTRPHNYYRYDTPYYGPYRPQHNHYQHNRYDHHDRRDDRRDHRPNHRPRR